MSKKVLGLDLGSNSIGWALMSEENGEVSEIVDLGSRIFNKAVEEKVPTPKNKKRRDMRLGRRVLQRRARRKQRMANYLISLDLLPQALSNNFGQEKLLNELGNPYELRTKGLDEQLTPHEFGRVILHFVARRGFLSSKKQVAGDLVDDPDTIEFLKELEEQEQKKRAAREAKLLAQGKIIKTTQDDQSEDAFKDDISSVYKAIQNSQCRTLGEYLYKRDNGKVKRNRSHDGGHLRTDRKMYQDELQLIWQTQQQYFPDLPKDFMEKNKGVLKIIFYQRPLKLRKDRVGKCLLEPKHYRANVARLEVQRFRYLQDVNNLKYSKPHSQERQLNDEQKDKLKTYFEHHPKITMTVLRKQLGLDKSTKINLETKNLKGNITACNIRNVIGDKWDKYSDEERSQLFEDLFTIKKKSALKKRLITHWGFDKQTAVKLCLIEFETSHSNHSLKAIKKLLPFLEQGLRYDEARVKAGYGYEVVENEVQNKLSAPLETSNPIVNKGMHELRRVVNAIIKQYGKPDTVRIEMARDLEMNTKRYKENKARQKKNQKANESATEAFRQETGRQYPSHKQKISYRLWEDQDKRCAYSGKTIALGQIFSAECEIDHILPFKKSLDDSYMNKVLCFEAENRNKGDRTPVDAWGGDNDKWNQITQAISRWDKSLKSKVSRFYMQEADLQERDCVSTQLNDTRYISSLAQDYMRKLGCDVNVTKGFVVSQIRHQWGFDNLIGEADKKDRTDHRHHAIDAVVIASTSRSLYQQAVRGIEHNKLKIPQPYSDILQELSEKLKHTIVSHVPQYKLSGALHEETGAGYLALKDRQTGKIIKQGLVYRKTLNQEFTLKNAQNIVDEGVRNTVLQHILDHDENTKKAFTSDTLKYLKLGQNPIKRVRVWQSETTPEKLAKTKCGIKDKQGNIFRWMAYGNNHHVEIIQHKETDSIKGVFVTMMEASTRAKGIGIKKQPIVNKNHGKDWQFLYALHINDLVSIEDEQEERIFYRVQKLAGGYDLTLRLHTDTSPNKINDKTSAETRMFLLKHKKILENSLKNFIQKYDMKLHKTNAIGKLLDD